MPLVTIFVPLGSMLSRLIIKTKINGLFKDIQVKESIKVSHLSFIDGILIFGKSILRENKLLKNYSRLITQRNKSENQYKYILYFSKWSK